MRNSARRLLIGVVIGLAGMFLLPAGRTRWLALVAWIVVWTATLVRREAMADRGRRTAPNE